MEAVSAKVTSQTPARTMARLCNHFKHRVNVVRDGDHALVEFPNASLRMDATEHEIQLHLQAEDAATIERLEGVVSKHLKQVAAPEELKVEWTGAHPRAT